MDAQFNLVLETFSSKKRNTIISEVKTAINNSGAWITDFTSLSEKLVNFKVECEASRLQVLFDELLSSGIEFYDYSIEQFKELISRKLRKEILISLNLSFVGGTAGDLGTKADKI